jgi:hypothetical protein
VGITPSSGLIHKASIMYNGPDRPPGSPAYPDPTEATESAAAPASAESLRLGVGPSNERCNGGGWSLTGC